jgi:hypothetical protein
VHWCPPALAAVGAAYSPPPPLPREGRRAWWGRCWGRCWTSGRRGVAAASSRTASSASVDVVYEPRGRAGEAVTPTSWSSTARCREPAWSNSAMSRTMPRCREPGLACRSRARPCVSAINTTRRSRRRTSARAESAAQAAGVVPPRDAANHAAMPRTMPRCHAEYATCHAEYATCHAALASCHAVNAMPGTRHAARMPLAPPSHSSFRRRRFGSQHRKLIGFSNTSRHIGGISGARCSQRPWNAAGRTSGRWGPLRAMPIQCIDPRRSYTSCVRRDMWRDHVD